MSESIPRSLSHFAVVSFTKPYWALTREARAELHAAWLDGLRGAANTVDIYQVFPTEHAADLIVWSAVEADEPGAAGRGAAGMCRRWMSDGRSIQERRPNGPPCAWM